MEFDSFVRIISKGIKGMIQKKFVIEIFEAANNNTMVTEDTANKWLKGKNHSYEKVFRDMCLYDNKFIEYLKNRTNTSWKEIQNNFKTQNDMGIIDCETNDVMVFLESILNQFKEIVGIPYKKKSPVMTAQNITLAEQMLEIFTQTIYNFDIANFIEVADPTVFLNVDFVEKVECFIKTIDRKIKHPFMREKKDKLYQKIIEFSCELDDYNKYLSCKMILSVNNKNILVPIFMDIITERTSKNNKNILVPMPILADKTNEQMEENNNKRIKFKQEVTAYRQRIYNLYLEICDIQNDTDVDNYESENPGNNEGNCQN
jgi:hypothetical protein